MAGIEFDRQVFTSAQEAQQTQAPKAMGVVILVLALALSGFVGYKIFTEVSQKNAIASANAQVEELHQQLADSQSASKSSKNTARQQRRRLLLRSRHQR